MNISTLTKTAALSAFIALGSYSAKAHAETVNLGALEPGKEYSWPQYATVQATYTPSVTGPVKFVYTQSAPLGLFTTPDHKDGTEVYGDFSYGDNGQIKSYPELQAGTTYYIYSALTMDAGSLVIYEGNQQLTLLGTIPSTDPENKDYYGGKFSISRNYSVNVNFNFPVSVGNVNILAPDDSSQEVTSKVYGGAVECDVAPALMLLYKTGSIKEGDEVTLRLFQVRDASDASNRYNGNGRCDITFTVAAKPVELVEVIGADPKSNENVFNSYYLPGDEAAIIKYVFDGPLSSEKNAVATIEYGNSDNIEVGVYSENVQASNEGNTAIFDFSGKIRRPIDMLPASDEKTQPEYIYVSFGNLFSLDGQRAYTGSKSNPSGYGMSFLINVLQYTVVGDFTPARGTEIKFEEPMEIWVMNGDKIRYDAIRFEYMQNGEQKYFDLPKDEVKETEDPYSEDARLYTFTVPTLPCDLNSNVIVRMTGVTCADGLDHSDDIYGEYTFGMSGIGEIGAPEAEALDVFDIAGVRVLSGADRDALTTLAKGIYIVNGKKVVIR